MVDSMPPPLKGAEKKGGESNKSEEGGMGMKVRFHFIIFLVLLTVSCVKMHMDPESYVGRPFHELVEAKGPPTDSTVIDDRLTIFHYEVHRTTMYQGRTAHRSCTTNVQVDQDGIITGYDYFGIC